MTLVSVETLFWMAGTVLAFWLAPGRLRQWLLVSITAAFLLIHDPVSAVILASLTGLTYALPRTVRATTKPVAAAAAIVVVTLVVFKVRLAWAQGNGEVSAAIPLGLSYYAFRCIHYLIERYKGALPDHGFGDFIAYMSFLPTLIAGPIHRFPSFRSDLARHRWNAALFSRGCERVLHGSVQVIILGNWLVSSKLAGFIETIDPSRAGLIEYLECLAFGLNVYFQFAGYSSIAIGFALLLGFRVVENFNYPFFRRNISEFWQSWHISLSSWCRDYVYMPVASLSRNVALGAIASMLVIGLWHELSLRYLGWGLYHGLGIVAWQAFQGMKVRLPANAHPVARLLADGIGIAVTFNFVVLSFAITKEPTLADAASSYATMLGW